MSARRSPVPCELDWAARALFVWCVGVLVWCGSLVPWFGGVLCGDLVVRCKNAEVAFTVTQAFTTTMTKWSFLGCGFTGTHATPLTEQTNDSRNNQQTQQTQQTQRTIIKPAGRRLLSGFLGATDRLLNCTVVGQVFERLVFHVLFAKNAWPPVVSSSVLLPPLQLNEPSPSCSDCISNISTTRALSEVCFKNCLCTTRKITRKISSPTGCNIFAEELAKCWRETSDQDCPEMRSKEHPWWTPQDFFRFGSRL